MEREPFPCSFPFLSFPFLSFPFLSFPFLSFPFLSFLFFLFSFFFFKDRIDSLSERGERREKERDRNTHMRETHTHRSPVPRHRPSPGPAAQARRAPTRTGNPTRDPRAFHPPSHDSQGSLFLFRNTVPHVSKEAFLFGVSDIYFTDHAVALAPFPLLSPSFLPLRPAIPLPPTSPTPLSFTSVGPR